MSRRLLVALFRRLRWVGLGLVVVGGLYPLAGALLSARYDGRVAAFRASEVHADLERRREEVPADENAVSLFPDVARRLEQVPGDLARYALYASAWSDDDLVLAVPDDADPEDAPPDWRAEERRRALASLAPFVGAIATALERPAVQFPLEWSETTRTMWLLRDMLPVRARLMPEHAAESADLLLRLGTRWRARDVSEPINRYQVMIEALRIVKDILASDPEGARPYLGVWREWLAAEDPLAEFRLQCATHILSTTHVVEQVRRGEDPFASGRESAKKIRKIVEDAQEVLRDAPVEVKETRLEPPEISLIFRWYARPVFYWTTIAAMDSWSDAIERARTEQGLHGLVEERAVDRITWIVGVQTLEQIALARLARTALAAALGDPLPELADPFTGGPLTIRHVQGATVIRATLPEGLRGGVAAPDLFSWEVRK